MNILTWFGIYKDAIERAYYACEQAMKDSGFTDKDIDRTIEQFEFWKGQCVIDLNLYHHLTDAIIEDMYRTTAIEICEKTGDTLNNWSWYVNCGDSHLYHNNGTTKDVYVWNEVI